MRSWEYKIAYPSEHVGGWIVDGKQHEAFAGLDDPEVLARLGREGWELVAVSGYTYFLKRPLDTPADSR